MLPDSPSLNDTARLADALVSMSRAVGVEAEAFRVRHLLHQAVELHPGPAVDRWCDWMSEAARSLHLRPRLAELTSSEAWELCRGGAALATQVELDGSATWWILMPSKSGVLLDRGDASPLRQFTSDKPTEFLPFIADAKQRWVVLSALELTHPKEGAEHHIAPISRLISILRPERQDLWTVVSFALFIGILSIASPIAVESLVNTVAFGSLLQPVLVLATILFGFLVFLAAITGLQTFVVEILQRRLFARVAADLSYRLPRAQRGPLDDYYFPELVNRFLEVVMLQKGTAYLLLDGVTIALTTLIGMTVLAFYHPWFLGFDVLLMGIVALGVYVLGRGAISSSVNESKQKYRLAGWFEEIARCPTAFKHADAADFAADRASFLTSEYLQARQSHFRLLFRQILFLLLLQAVAATITLGFGGWLVIQGQLTLGQLVAAELIVSAILVSLAKLGKHLEGLYDLLAAVDKLGKLFDLPIERQEGVLHLGSTQGAAVELTDVQCTIGGRATFRRALTASIPPGTCLALEGPAGSGKSVLCDLLFALRHPSQGHVEVDAADPTDVRPDILRQHVALVRAGDAFAGTLSENLLLGKATASHQELRAALAAVGLLEQALRLPKGLDTQLTSEGFPLSQTQQSQLLIARALVQTPRLLLIDGVLDSFPKESMQRLFRHLRQLTNCTILIATNSKIVAHECDSSWDLRSGTLSRQSTLELSARVGT